MVWFWVGVVVVVVAALVTLGGWMNRRQDELLPHESTLSDEDKAGAQLGIAMTAGNTFNSGGGL